MAKFDIVTTGEKANVDYNSEQESVEAADRDGRKIIDAFKAFNAALSSGNLKIPEFKGKFIPNAVESTLEIAARFRGSIGGLGFVLLDDYANREEKGLRLELGDKDKTKILIPVTPDNVNALTRALGAATKTATELKSQIGPQNPGKVDDIQAQVFGKLKQDLGEFIPK
jgi:hypothetical protein